MKRFLIEDLVEVAIAMYYSITDDKLNEVMFVGCYEDAVSVIKNLLIFDEVTPYHISIKSEDWDGYDKEYYITLDDKLNIWCEQAYSFEINNYFYDGTERLFIADDCDSAILKKVECDKDNVYEVSYDLDDECDGNCERCHCSEEKDSHEVVTRVATDENGKLRGFEKSWETLEDGLHYHSTYSFYSSNEDMLKNMLENFNIKY